ncbi:Sugar phosphate isomerase/epimerase [Paenibacillus sp. UNCCL117]|uniref:sugar phosphate isomerase/epimerase family protein n=1 Tax=unclassified Paenibacillus TaxID=185978 RepID=UPI00087F87CB|nr:MULTISPECIES: sugar phosphate isomerase/epimerase [unclassified Paenibacillus]SDD04747.1 Sugar phosphate isomerase/epimerase [Paenibacillus sp. cl123]SFW32016.1 Sugar phosphate isomerase/epimerase [Paenibacillus sp. UNCCL117]
MQRLAFSTIPCAGWALEDMAAAAKKDGFRGLELREGDAWSIHTGMTPDQRKHALQVVKEAGLTITDIGSGVCFTGSEGDAEQLRHFKEVARLAQDLEARGVRVFLGYFTNRIDQPVPDISYPALVDLLRQACDYAAAYGVQLWIETHNEFSTGRILRKLLDDVSRDNCMVIYDVIHPLEEGEDPAETVALLGSQCVHVHIKDGVPAEDPMATNWKYTKVGEGQIPISSIVALLEQSGYAGYYSLEWETKWRSELQVPGMEPDVIFPHYVAYMHNLFKSLESRV